MVRLLKLLLVLSVIGAVGLAAYALVAELPAPVATRTVPLTPQPTSQ